MNREMTGIGRLTAVLSIAALAVTAIGVISTQAATYTWTKTAAGTYEWAADPSNWTSGFPNVADDIANLDINLAGAQTINLTQTITLGTLEMGDPTSTWYATTVSANGGSLIMDVTTGNAVISKTSTANRTEDKINANILLNDHLTLNSAQTDARGELTITGIISGTGKSVTKTGAGLVRLVGVQAYDGGTTISAGTLQLGNGSGANTTVVGSIVNNGWLSFNDADARSFAAANYSGTGGLDKQGAGVLTLTGDFDVNGGLRVGYRAAGGTVVVGSGDSLAVGSGSSDLLYVGVGYDGKVGSGTLNVSEADSFTANVGTVYVGINQGGGGTGAAGTGTLSLGVDNDITAATKVVIGGGDPDGNTGISGGCNGYVTTAAGGTTTIATPYMALGTAKGTQGSFTLGAGATLNLGSSEARTELIVSRNTATTSTNAGTMNLAGGGTGVANLYLSKLSLAYTTTGANLNGNMTLSDSSSNNLNVSGASGTGGVVQIGYNNTTGTTVGTLTIGHAGSTSAVTSTDNGTAILIARKGIGTSTGTLTIKAGMLTITTTGAAIAGGGGTSSLYLGETGNVTLKAGASSTDWINGLTTAEIKSEGATIDTNGFDIGISQAFSGEGGLIKAGTGTLTLSGSNSYLGETKIQNGTLNITGAVGGSLLTVESSGTLGGNGTISASLVFDSGSKLAFSTSNTLTYGGTQPVSFTGFSVASLVGLDNTVDFGTYLLIDGAVDLENGVSNVGVGDPYNLGAGKIAYFQSGSLELVVAAIPEPATLGLMGVVGVAMLLRRRMVKA